MVQDLSQFNLPIAELERRFKRVMLRLPAIIGNEGINFILDNFKKQGFQGAVFTAWPKRKNPTKWGTTPPRNGRALLVLTGRYRRSWRYITEPDGVRIGTDDPKAKALNNGYTGPVTQTVRPFTRKKTYTDEVSKPGAKKQSFKKIDAGVSKVKGHTRTIKHQRIAARPVYGSSPILEARYRRIATLEFIKEFKM